MKTLCKSAVSAEFRAIRVKLCGNCAFPQNYRAWKLGEIIVFSAVKVTRCPWLYSENLLNCIGRPILNLVALSCHHKNRNGLQFLEVGRH